MKNNYAKITDDRFHNIDISAQMDTLLVQLDVISQGYKIEAERSIIKAWDSISPFIDSLLNLSSSHPEFFLPFGRNLIDEIETNDKSLRNKYGFLSDMIYGINSTSNFVEIRSLAKNINKNFISSESYVYKIFYNIITKDFMQEFDVFLEMIKTNYEDAIIKINAYDKLNFDIDIPKLLLLDGIFEQILNNFRHADLSEPITIELDLNFVAKNVGLTIINKCMDPSFNEYGGGTGLQQLNDLNSFPNNSVEYNCSDDEGIFIQVIKLKKI